jgi:hypothetical protein
MTLRQVLLEEAEATYSVAEKLFRRVADQELSWTPAPGGNWMSMGQLLMHCASFGCGKAIQGFVKGDWGLPENSGIDALTSEDHVPQAAALPSVMSVEQALGLLAGDRSLAVSCIEAVDEGNLLNLRIAAPWGGPEVSLFQQLLHTVAHLAQHKG